MRRRNFATNDIFQSPALAVTALRTELARAHAPSLNECPPSRLLGYSNMCPEPGAPYHYADGTRIFSRDIFTERIGGKSRGGKLGLGGTVLYGLGPHWVGPGLEILARADLY